LLLQEAACDVGQTIKGDAMNGKSIFTLVLAMGLSLQIAQGASVNTIIYSNDFSTAGSLSADGWWVETAGQGVISGGYVSLEGDATYEFGETYALGSGATNADHTVDSLWMKIRVKVPTEGTGGRAVFALGNSDYLAAAGTSSDDYEFGKFAGAWLYDDALATSTRLMCVGRLSTYTHTFDSDFMDYVLKITDVGGELEVKMWVDPADVNNLGNPQKTNILPYDDKYIGEGYEGLFDQIELRSYNFSVGMQIDELIVWTKTSSLDEGVIYSSDYSEDGSLGAEDWWVETAGQGVISNGYVSVEDKATYSFGDTYALNENVEADYNVDALWVSFSVKVPTEGNDGRAIIALGNSEYYVNADGTDDQYEFGKFGGVWLYDTALRTEAKTMCAGRLSTYVAAFPSTFMNFVLKISETNDQLQVQMWYNPADLDNLGNPQKTNIKPYDDKYTGMGYQGLFDQIELNAYNFSVGMQISNLVVWSETIEEGFAGFVTLNGLSGVKTDDNDLDGLADYGEYVFGGNPTDGTDLGELPQFDAINGDYSFSLIGDNSVIAHVMTNSDLVAGTWGTNATVSVTASNGVLNAYTNSVGTDASQVFIKLIVE
jgi:hypothetical protein